MRTNTSTTLGVANSVMASVLFAAMYYYATLLKPLNGEQIYGWRILATIPFLTILLMLTGQASRISLIWKRSCQQPLLWLGLLATSLLVGFQLWLFMWAPVNGQGLSVSLGYFLLPLTLVLTGHLVFREKLSRMQAVACGVAGIGMINQLVNTSTVSWPMYAVALLYPAYFVLRRKLGTDHLGGMWFDMVISLPVAAWFATSTLHSTSDASFNGVLLGVMLVGLGLLSALALLCMMAASHQLSLSLFGLLIYVEPALLLIVALSLGERISSGQWLTYGCIWAAILILVVEGLKNLRCAKT